jgi:hypothetical protein
MTGAVLDDRARAVVSACAVRMRAIGGGAEPASS